MAREKVEYILNKLYEGMYEREDAIRLSLLTSMAGESIFLLGPPGVAKSLIARRMKYVFKDAKNFEYLMGRFSTPDEIFGPISISKLKNEDKYERIIDGYLPDSEIVFLDEIWKASPAIQNTLLTAINEKIFRNGNREMRIKLKLLIAASNELPAEGEGLEALWDRFIVRLYVDGIKDREKFEKMISDTGDLYSDNIEEKYKITADEYERWQREIKKIKVPPEVFQIIDVIRKKIVLRNQKDKEKTPIYISDRRWKKIIKLLRTSAFLNGRDRVDIMDCFLISHMIWSRVEEIEEVKAIIHDVIAKYGYKVGVDVTSVRKSVDNLRKDIKNNTQREVIVETKVPKEYEFKDERGHKQEFFKFISSNLGECYIRKSDFEDLRVGEFKEVNLYRKYSSEHVRPKGMYVVEKIDDISLKIKHPGRYRVRYGVSDMETVELEHEIVKKTVREGRIPSSDEIRGWDREIGKLNSKLDEMILRISEYKNRDLKYTKNNLFVEPDLANIAFRSLDQSSQEIAKLKIELEKLRSLYEAER